jgi:serine/threonine protein kinase
MTGRTVAHFEILEKLGEGGMGVVWKARDTRLDRLVALKVLPSDKVADPERKRRFAQEARAASALNHPNIVTIYEIAREDDVDFIAMEYVAGRSLQQLIPRKGLSIADSLKYSVQIADALAKAHAAGIVHRDLKPGNILINDEGTVKVVDFGLAKLTETADSTEEDPTRTIRRETQEGAIVGTLSYMSPEQAEGKKVDARSDIFAFGVVLYEMVTGRRAFQGASAAATLAAILHQDPKPLRESIPDAPPELGKLISRCLRKDRERRFQHAGDLKVELVELREEFDSGTLLVAPEPSHPSAGMRKKWALPAASVVLVAAISLFAVNWHKSTPAGPPVIVLMDTSAPMGVYDSNTRQNSGTNADDLSDDLRDLPVALHKENIGAAWNRENEVVKEMPDLIVIHRSAFFHAMNLDFQIGYGPFSDASSDQPPEAGKLPSGRYLYDHLNAAAMNRLEAFLGYVGLADRRARFLIYSRGHPGDWDDVPARLGAEPGAAISPIDREGIHDGRERTGESQFPRPGNDRGVEEVGRLYPWIDQFRGSEMIDCAAYPSICIRRSRTVSATEASGQITSTVSSPARVPTTSGQDALSSATATELACPGAVRSTI